MPSNNKPEQGEGNKGIICEDGIYYYNGKAYEKTSKPDHLGFEIEKIPDYPWAVFEVYSSGYIHASTLSGNFFLKQCPPTPSETSELKEGEEKKANDPSGNIFYCHNCGKDFKESSHSCRAEEQPATINKEKREAGEEERNLLSLSKRLIQERDSKIADLQAKLSEQAQEIERLKGIIEEAGIITEPSEAFKKTIAAIEGRINPK